MDPEKALKDFIERVHQYEAVYEPLEDTEDGGRISYIKVRRRVNESFNTHTHILSNTTRTHTFSNTTHTHKHTHILYRNTHTLKRTHIF